MEFTDEYKQTMLDQINTLKKMLDTLAKDINEIETGNALEFITPLIQAGRVETEAILLHKELKEWQDMDDSFETTGEY